MKVLVNVPAHQWRQRKVNGRLDRRCQLKELVCPEVGDRRLDRDDVGRLARGAREDLLVERLREELDPDRINPRLRRVYERSERAKAQAVNMATLGRDRQDEWNAPSVTIAWPSSFRWRTDGL